MPDRNDHGPTGRPPGRRKLAGRSMRYLRNKERTEAGTAPSTSPPAKKPKKRKSPRRRARHNSGVITSTTTGRRATRLADEHKQEFQPVHNVRLALQPAQQWRLHQDRLRQEEAKIAADVTAKRATKATLKEKAATTIRRLPTICESDELTFYVGSGTRLPVDAGFECERIGHTYTIHLWLVRQLNATAAITIQRIVRGKLARIGFDVNKTAAATKATVETESFRNLSGLPFAASTLDRIVGSMRMWVHEKVPITNDTFIADDKFCQAKLHCTDEVADAQTRAYFSTRTHGTICSKVQVRRKNKREADIRRRGTRWRPTVVAWRHADSWQRSAMILEMVRRASRWRRGTARWRRVTICSSRSSRSVRTQQRGGVRLRQRSMDEFVARSGVETGVSERSTLGLVPGMGLQNIRVLAQRELAPCDGEQVSATEE